jgi:2,5-diamino-6-(ribosylamino)-4(3H)-pyrimidinone 5'-phosphate reductase
VKRDRPFVCANFAVTADGRISTRNLTPANFSSKRDKRRLVEIRAKCDAVMASAKTIASDNMTMGLPAEDLRAERIKRGMAPYPTRVLLTNSGRISPELRLFTKDFSPVVIFSTEQMPADVRAALATKATLYLHHGKRVDLHGMLRTLRKEHGVKRLVCEGGAQIFRALLEAGLIDELNLTIIPRIFGGKRAPTLTGIAGKYLAASTRLKLREFSPIEGECFLRYTIAG